MINLAMNPRLADDAFGHEAVAGVGLTAPINERALLPAGANRNEWAWRSSATQPDNTPRILGWISPTSQAETVPVEENVLYTVFVEIYVASVTSIGGSPTARIDTTALDADNNQVSTSTGTGIAVATPGWLTYVRTRLTPVGAVRLRVNPELRFVDGGSAADVYFSRSMVVEGDVTANLPPFFDGDFAGAEWLGTPRRSSSRFPVETPEVLVPGRELLVAQRAFPAAQRLLAGARERRIGTLVDVGWHGTDVYPIAGSTAIVQIAGALDDPFEEESLVGEVLRVARGNREVFVYVAGARDVPADLSLSRRAFAALGGLYLDRVRTVVEVVR